MLDELVKCTNEKYTADNKYSPFIYLSELF